MIEARMSDDLAQSRRPKGGNATGAAKNLLRSLSEIGGTLIKYVWRPHSVSDVTTENSRENAPEQAPPVATALEDAVVKPSVTKTFPAPVTADVIIGPKAQTNAHIVPDDLEIQRRRDLVRTLFNDFWSEANDKPAAFVDRLAQSEPYINERLMACGEFWQLNAETRIILGLPSTKNRPNPR
ncbi:MAG: hypothetical protein WAK55_25260 [Xanthobacteraceae bacterium]